MVLAASALQRKNAAKRRLCETAPTRKRPGVARALNEPKRLALEPHCDENFVPNV